MIVSFALTLSSLHLLVLRHRIAQQSYRAHTRLQLSIKYILHLLNTHAEPVVKCVSGVTSRKRWTRYCCKSTCTE